MDNQRSYMHAKNVSVSILNKENVCISKVGETHGHLMSHDKSDKRVTKQEKLR
jgi:hypothetical protein